MLARRWSGHLPLPVPGRRWAWCLPSSICGAAGMERAAQVPKEIALVMQAVIILFVASRVSLALVSPDRKETEADDDV